MDKYSKYSDTAKKVCTNLVPVSEQHLPHVFSADAPKDFHESQQFQMCEDKLSDNKFGHGDQLDFVILIGANKYDH